jgi:hypothetical protein
VPGEVFAVRQSLAEKHVHDRAGERAIRARTDHERHVGLAHRLVHVDVDGDDFRTAFLPRANGVRHHVDLRRDGIGAPDHDAVALRHLSWISTRKPAGAGHVAGPGRVDADRLVEARPALGMAKAVDAIPVHAAHRARVVIGPDGFRAVPALRRKEPLGSAVQRLVPGYPRKLAGALGANALQRMHQPVGMMDALSISRNFRADHARRVGVVGMAAHATDGRAIDHLDIKRAG